MALKLLRLDPRLAKAVLVLAAGATLLAAWFFVRWHFANALTARLDSKRAESKLVVDWLTMGTAVAGVFAAGDVVTYPTKFDLIATGYAEAVTAANHCVHYIHPEKRLEPGHSSNMTAPPSQATAGAADH